MKSPKALIRDYLSKRLRLPEIPQALRFLRERNFEPNLIFDVGAYRGDFASLCCDLWPKSTIACFEALPPKVAALQQMAKDRENIRVFPTLLGAAVQDAVPFNEAETASSVLSEHIPQNFPVRMYPMTTVDSAVEAQFAGAVPDLIKIDVQGYELEVLKGAEQSLTKAAAVLAELNLIDIHRGAPLFGEIISWLDQRDWVAYDICGLTRRPLDGALWQADFLFVPRDSVLRSNKAWGS